MLGVSPRRVRRAIAAGLVREAEVVRGDGRVRVRVPRQAIAGLRLEPSPLERRVHELSAEVAALRAEIRGATQEPRTSTGTSLVAVRRADDGRARTLLGEIDAWLRTHHG